MLVVTRRHGESVLIGDNIEVKVWHCGEGQIRVGIEAPRDVPISRKELGSPAPSKHQRPQEATRD